MPIEFRHRGGGAPVDLTAYAFSAGINQLDIVNTGSTDYAVQFPISTAYSTPDRLARINAGTTYALDLTVTTIGAELVYHASELVGTEYAADTYRYNPRKYGRNRSLIPVTSALHASYKLRAEDLISRARVADNTGNYIYTPGGPYATAGIFARDFLYTLEGNGYDQITLTDLQYCVDLYLSKQAAVDFATWGNFAPAGSVPDHIAQNGQLAWTPGVGGAAEFNRPSLDEHFCLITCAWFVGYKRGWDATWLTWFDTVAAKLELAYGAVPFNATSGLHCQWPTGNPCVTWGFLDSEILRGDVPGLSVLAYNASSALADMYEKASNAAKVTEWENKATALKTAIRAVFRTGSKPLNNVSTPYGYLEWSIGGHAGTQKFSPDITGYAIWSGILTDEQAAAASDWLAAIYTVDKVAANGRGHVFNTGVGRRGTVREAMRPDDYSIGGQQVWPETFLGNVSYETYQNGGYWYYNSGWIFAALNVNHPDLAAEIVTNCYTDVMADVTGKSPYERFDSTYTPVNDYYTASAAAIYGISIPAETISVTMLAETSPFKTINGAVGSTLKTITGAGGGTLKKLVGGSWQ